jgi:precorrin-4 methylase
MARSGSAMQIVPGVEASIASALWLSAQLLTATRDLTI